MLPPIGDAVRKHLRGDLIYTMARQEQRLKEIVAITVPANIKSQQMMRRLGMTHSSTDDFDHPCLPEGHRMRRCVLYRLSRSDWSRQSRHDNLSWCLPSALKGR